jgi:peptidyl-prolyl cis-trans isomerase SurA
MIKKKIFILFFLLFFNNSINAKEVFITVTVNDQIITNYDIEKEGEYLSILNPQLTELNKEEIYKISKSSLINEIIKTNEIKKFSDLEKDTPFLENYLKDLYTKLNFENELKFKNFLENNDIYSLKKVKDKIKIEIFWNEFIYSKYNFQVKIDKEKLLKKINQFTNQKRKEYLLSEIVFQLKNNEDQETITKQIKSSISEIGFNNTANIYSISESSKFGGKIGWVNENNLSETISSELQNINEGQFTNLIKIGNNFLILKIEETKEKIISVDKEKELEKMLKFETNKQLNQFSRIYFNKAKLNYTLNEK